MCCLSNQSNYQNKIYCICSFINVSPPIILLKESTRSEPEKKTILYNPERLLYSYLNRLIYRYNCICSCSCSCCWTGAFLRLLWSGYGPLAYCHTCTSVVVVEHAWSKQHFFVLANEHMNKKIRNKTNNNNTHATKKFHRTYRDKSCFRATICPHSLSTQTHNVGASKIKAHMFF